MTPRDDTSGHLKLEVPIRCVRSAYTASFGPDFHPQKLKSQPATEIQCNESQIAKGWVFPNHTEGGQQFGTRKMMKFRVVGENEKEEVILLSTLGDTIMLICDAPLNGNHNFFDTSISFNGSTFELTSAKGYNNLERGCTYSTPKLYGLRMCRQGARDWKICPFHIISYVWATI